MIRPLNKWHIAPHAGIEFQHAYICVNISTDFDEVFIIDRKRNKTEIKFEVLFVTIWIQYLFIDLLIYLLFIYYFIYDN